MTTESCATYDFHPLVLVLLGLSLSGVHLGLALKFLLVAPPTHRTGILDAARLSGRPDW